MIIGVPKESFPGERRVAMVPSVVPSLTKAGFEVAIEAGAGVSAGYLDKDYADKGARILGSRAEVFKTADVVVQVLCYGSNDRTGKDDVPLYRQGQFLVGFLRPLGAVETLKDIASKGVSSFSMELMPRITRAQSMDALSSMATVGGYKAVLLAADTLPRLCPDADHRRGNDHAGPHSRHRRGRGRTPGHRHGAPAGCRRLRLRRASRGEGAGAEPRRPVRRAAASRPRTPRTRAATPRRRTRRSTSASGSCWGAWWRKATW